MTLVAGLVFGLAPAVRASRPDLVPALKQDPARSRTRRIMLRHVFVVSQIALSVLLLVGAGLLLRTVLAFTQLSPGFATERIVVGSVDVSLQGYNAERARQFFETLTSGAARLPGVSSVALGRMVPVDVSGMRVTFTPSGRKPSGKDSPLADYNPVSPGYFATLGIPLLEGRDFSVRDLPTAPPVVIVNQALARRYFGTDRAVGQRLVDFGPSGGNPEIVGVVGDARYRALRDEPAPMIYVPHAQGFMPRMSLVVRTTVAPESVIPALTAVASSLDADLPLFQVRTMRERMQASLAVERLLAWLLAGFAALAVFLAAAGLYGVVSYLTTIQDEGVRHPPRAWRDGTPAPSSRRRSDAGPGDGGAAGWPSALSGGLATAGDAAVRREADSTRSPMSASRWSCAPSACSPRSGLPAAPVGSIRSRRSDANDTLTE